jgi:predicted DsbA family dithiol-disulfide isomerase
MRVMAGSIAARDCSPPLTGTPNTFKGHVLLAAAFKGGVQKQNLVAGLFQAYFLNGEDVGNPATLPPTIVARLIEVTTPQHPKQIAAD